MMRIAKMLFAGLLIVTYSLISLIGSAFLFNNRARTVFLTKTTSFFCNTLLAVLDITAVALHSPLWRQDKPYLVVSNHLSYLDIIAIASTMPAVFVSSMEIRAAAFLGFIARCGGTIFIERRKKMKNLKREIRTITETLKQGLNVVIFPEGTSSNGTGVLPFKRSLMETAFQSNSDVLPVCLMYSHDSEKLSGPSKESVFWYGDMKFFSHFFNLFKQSKLVITLQIMEPLRIDAYADRNSLTEDAYLSIAAAYNWQKPYAYENDLINPMDLSFER